MRSNVDHGVRDKNSNTRSGTPCAMRDETKLIVQNIKIECFYPNHVDREESRFGLSAVTSWLRFDVDFAFVWFCWPAGLAQTEINHKFQQKLQLSIIEASQDWSNVCPITIPYIYLQCILIMYILHIVYQTPAPRNPVCNVRSYISMVQSRYELETKTEKNSSLSWFVCVCSLSLWRAVRCVRWSTLLHNVNIEIEYSIVRMSVRCDTIMLCYVADVSDRSNNSNFPQSFLIDK